MAPITLEKPKVQAEGETEAGAGVAQALEDPVSAKREATCACEREGAAAPAAEHRHGDAATPAAKHCHGDSCACEHDHGHAPVVAHHLDAEPDFTFTVAGIDCPSCAKSCENAVRVTDGVVDASLDYVTSTLSVAAAPDADPTRLTKAVLDTVRSCGLDLDLPEAELERLDASRSWWDEHREVVLMAASGAGIAVGLVLEFALALALPSVAVYTAAAVAGLVFVGPMAFAALGRRTADMNVLMGIAVAGALIMGFYELSQGMDFLDTFRDAAIVIFLDQIGEWLEAWSMRRTRGSIEGLMALAPEVAHVVEGEVTGDVALDDVEEGWVVRVLPGERVPLDGTILEGDSSLDESPVTGESVPLDKGPGDAVFGGTLNTVAPLTVRVTDDADCGTLARIVNLVQGAQAERAPYESFVDRFAAVYTPIVVGVALAVGLGAPLALALFGQPVDWLGWIWRALTLLVIACPCALVISTPVSFVSAITRAAKLGVLVKGGAYLDIASKVDAVAFDKTGTVTEGRPQVESVVCAEGEGRDRALALAAALEANSTHPLAVAVVTAAEEAGVASALPAVGVREIAGHGMEGVVCGETVRVGKPSYVREALGELPAFASDAIAQIEAGGGTALGVVAGSGACARLVGVLGLRDAVRDSSARAIERLGHAGVVQTVMLTGDNERAARAVADSLGITTVRARLLPDDKLGAIKNLQQEGRTVAMVGDGINDAPALAQADLGITMGAAASDTALEVADVALLAGDLSALPAFLKLSKRTLRVVRENIAFAIGVKFAVMVLAVLGLAGMGAAIFADTGVALIVILNGMRLMVTRLGSRT